MALLGIDLGGTKAAFAIFRSDGTIISRETLLLQKRKGKTVGMIITVKVLSLLEQLKEKEDKVESIGISVPGVFHSESGTVWAPNIPGWEDYPLRKEVESISGGIPVVIDSDRACSILGELWKGNAAGCSDAVFLTVGTGIGAGILVNGEVLRGSHDIAGAIGWMAMERPYLEKYKKYGCFEYYASGEGIARMARDYIKDHKEYKGELGAMPPPRITSYDVLSAYESGDKAAGYIIHQFIAFWGMAVANIVSLFNPEKVILGGGMFGPAVKFIPSIREEALKWGQPVSTKLVSIEPSALGSEAAVYGAAFLAMKRIDEIIISG
jgi:glucokinase